MNNKLCFSNEFFSMEINSLSGVLEYFGTPEANKLVPAPEVKAFSLGLRDDAGTLIIMTSADFQKPALKVSEEKEKSQFVLSFHHENIDLFIVDIVVNCLTDSAFSSWRLNASGIPQEYALEWVDCPHVNFDRKLKGNGGEGEVFWPANEGCLIDDISIREDNPWLNYRLIDYPTRGVWGFYPGDCQMQYMAYLNGNDGVYFGAHDAGHRPKGVEIVPENDDVFRLNFQVFCGGEVTEGTYKMPFDIVLGVMPDGDWMTAASIYRSWLESSDKSLPEKLADNKSIPGWYAESPVIMAYSVRGDGDDKGELLQNEYFPYVNAMPHVEKYAELFDSKIMSLIMHWEGTAPWAPPYVWPPFGGEDKLKDYTEALHKQDHLLGVYCSGTAWTQTSSIIDYSCEKKFEDENLADEMCIGPEGEMKAVICNGKKGEGQRLGYDMCIAREWVQKTVLDEIGKIADAGIDYIQFFDQNMGGGPHLCYSKKHEHPDFPGKWHTDAMLDLLKDVDKISASSEQDIVIGCEAAAAQPFIKTMLFNDLRFNLNWMFGKSVPAYGFIFHEYVNNFMGNQVCFDGVVNNEKCPDNLLFRLAYSFNSGDMLTILLKDKGQIHWNWVNKWSNPAPEQEPLIELIRNLNTWRRKYKEFLCFGKMLKPYPISGQKEYSLIRQDNSELAYESVLCSRWQSPNGRTAQFLTNFLPEKQTVELTVPGKTKAVVIEDPFDGKKSELALEGGKVKLELAPLSAVMLEFA